jgi:hypothetical protein
VQPLLEWMSVFCVLLFTRMHGITCKKAVMFIVLLYLFCQSYVYFSVYELHMIVNM